MSYFVKGCVAVLILFAGCCMGPAYALARQAIQSQINKDRKQYAIEAMAVSFSVGRNGAIQTFYSGDVKQHALFQVGSITKSFIAATVLQLEGSHQLNINRSIGHYFPQYPKWKNITIRQLLNHTSGIYNYTHLPVFDHIKTMKNDHIQWRPTQIVAVAYRHKLYFKPGQGFHYSNTNYILLGMLIKKITGSNVQQVLNQRFLRRSGYDLINTFYLPGLYSPYIETRLAPGYFNATLKQNINMSWAGAAGALVSTSSDLVRWIRLLFVGDLLQPPQLKQLKSVVSAKNGASLPDASHQFVYGLGIKRVYRPALGFVWFHPGITTGYTAIMLWVPRDKIALAVTTNSGSLGKKNIKRIAYRLLNAFL